MICLFWAGWSMFKWMESTYFWMTLIALSSRRNPACHNHQWPAKAFSRCPIMTMSIMYETYCKCEVNIQFIQLKSLRTPAQFPCLRDAMCLLSGDNLPSIHSYHIPSPIMSCLFMLDLWASAYHASCTLELLGMLWMWLGHATLYLLASWIRGGVRSTKAC